MRSRGADLPLRCGANVMELDDSPKLAPVCLADQKPRLSRDRPKLYSYATLEQHPKRSLQLSSSALNLNATRPSLWASFVYLLAN